MASPLWLLLAALPASAIGWTAQDEAELRGAPLPDAAASQARFIAETEAWHDRALPAPTERSRAPRAPDFLRHGSSGSRISP